MFVTLALVTEKKDPRMLFSSGNAIRFGENS
jgi:hypothetical protein